MIGALFLSLSFALAVISGAAYLMALRGKGDRYTRIARFGFHGSVISFMITSAILMYFILTHQYQYTYIWQHSSNSLSRPLLMASFYAGQQGSFMLWTLLTSLIGVFVLSYSQRVRYEAYVMTPYMLVLSCLLFILVFDSPFETIYASFPEEKLPAGYVPQDGKGLNPQLENLWITIHPPMLFVGFAAMTVPFVFALAGMIKRDYQRWIAVSLPWALFASMILGFGIMLGGWWAYETLGWGGFWAWDPVENSSLIPWLACVALVHTMLVQKRTGSVSPREGGEQKVGGLVKTNFFLAVMAFGLILYSTFLTRSGVLGDTSVHSFVSPGGFIYGILIVILLLFVGLGMGLLAYRWKELRQESMNFPLMSRENALGLGSAVILASALVVLIGTSWPLILAAVGKPKVAIPIDFYNKLHLPIAFLLVLLNGISMRMKWKNTDPKEFLRSIWWALGIAVAGTVLLVVLGIHDPIYIALGFGSLLALVSNLQIGLKVMRGNPRFVGAYVSHAGVALMMLGVIFTARYSVTEHIRLVQGVPAKIFDYSITYHGPERFETEKTDREKYRHKVVLEKDGATYEANPVIFWSDFNKRESAFLEPGILYSPTRDIYISPKALDEEGGNPTVTMKKGDRAVVPFDSSIAVRFEKFDMSRAADEGMQGAVMSVDIGDSVHYLTSYRHMQNGSYLPVTIPGTDITLGMYGLEADKENLSNSKATIVFASPSHPMPPAKAAITLDVSIKPFISFVWAGVIIMVGGFFFSIIRRRKEIDAFIPKPDQGDGEPRSPQGRREPVPAKTLEEPIAARTGLRK